MQKKY